MKEITGFISSEHLVIFVHICKIGVQLENNLKKYLDYNTVISDILLMKFKLWDY